METIKYNKVRLSHNGLTWPYLFVSTYYKINECHCDWKQMEVIIIYLLLNKVLGV